VLSAQRGADGQQQGVSLIAVEQPKQHRNAEYAPLPARQAFGVMGGDVGGSHFGDLVNSRKIFDEDYCSGFTEVNGSK
jgi:hypothetical protein